jgi:hypothetical protein
MEKNSTEKLIWTHHILKRLQERKITKTTVERTFLQFDQKIKGDIKGTTLFKKRFGSQIMTLICKREADGWIALSCWIDPPMKGSLDEKKNTRYKKYQRSTILGKLWMNILKLFFGYQF